MIDIEVVCVIKLLHICELAVILYKHNPQMKKATIIGLILILSLRLIPTLLYFTNSIYIHVLIYNLLFCWIIIYYFKKLQKNDVKYLTAIVIALLIPFIIYNMNFAITHIYYFFNPEEKKEIEMMLQMSRMNNNQGGLLSLLTKFNSPLQYSFFDSLTNKKITDTIHFYQNGQYILSLSQFISIPIILLAYYSKYELFKKLSIKKPLLSALFPFNYFTLIDKFGLSRIWKIYLLIPIFNFFIMYRINLKITNQFKIENSDSLGMIFLPFIYYPKMIFRN